MRREFNTVYDILNRQKHRRLYLHVFGQTFPLLYFNRTYFEQKLFYSFSLSLTLFCLHFTLLTTGRDIELEYFLCSFFYEKEFNNQLTDWDSIYSRFFTGGFEPLTSALCSGKQCVWIQNFPYIQIAYTYLFGLPIQLNMKPVVQCDPCLKLQKVRSVIIPIL